MEVEKIIKKNLDTVQQSQSMFKKALLDAANCSDFNCQLRLIIHLINDEAVVTENLVESVRDSIGIIVTELVNIVSLTLM